MGLLIRSAGKEDLETIAQFNVLMAQETENKSLDESIVSKGVANLFTQPNFGFYLVAEQDKEIAACLLITYEWSDWRNGLFWWIQSVYVTKNYRCRGIFRKMYEHLITLSNEKDDVCGLRLYVEKDNRHAQQTYRSMGMSETDYCLFEDIFE